MTLKEWLNNLTYNTTKDIWKLTGLDTDSNLDVLNKYFGKGDYSSESKRESLRQRAIVSNSGDDILAAIGSSDMYNYASDDDAGKQQTIDFLNRLQTLDQRQYDAKLTKEARQYDSPQSQLARLMSTGLSRDAALSIISGGTGVTVQNNAQPVPTDASMFPSLSNLNKVQSVTSSIGAACQIVNTALGAASFGISLPSMFSANSISQSQSRMLGAQVSAMNDIGKISSLATEAIRSGSVKTDSLLDRDSFISAMDGIYKGNADYESSLNSLLSNPYGTQMLDSYVNQNFSTKRVRPTADFVQKATAAALNDFYASQLNVDTMSANLSKIREETNRIVQEITQSDLTFPDILQHYDDEHREFDARIAQIEQSTSNLVKSGYILDSERVQKEQENYIRSWTVKNYEMNGDDYNTASALELSIKLNSLSAADSEEAKLAVFESIVDNKKSARCLAAVNLLSAQGSSDFMSNHPEIQPLIGMVDNTNWMQLYQTYLQSKGIKGLWNGLPQDMKGQLSDFMRIAGSRGDDPLHIMQDVFYK